MNEHGICEECNQPNTFVRWCNTCNAKRFQQNFKNWTSGNNNIDKFIQNTQLSAIYFREVLEWIPYNRFYNIKYVAKGGFGNVYRANWIDGYIWYWNNTGENWYKCNQNEFVALKSLNNSKNVTLEFINEITSHHKLNKGHIVRFYGITQDPETKNYIMVLDYAENGDLRSYLDSNKNYDKNWFSNINTLRYIAHGLNIIHEKGLIHRDLHVGNILVLKHPHSIRITDMGLCKPADYNISAENAENTKNNVYGVLPYIAPEILREKNYTKAADIYSLGIIMYEVFSGLPPYYDVSHDEYLAMKVCNGLRPMFNIKVPQLILSLIKRCLDANPLNRPTAKELYQILSQWHNELYHKTQAELQKQIEEAEEINKDLITTSSLHSNTSLSYEAHSEAIYTSRLLNFNDLPEPKNAYDYYYEQNDNLTSKKFSESLQIDISQFN